MPQTQSIIVASNPTHPAGPVFLNPAGCAARSSMSESWIYEQIKLYRDTNGRRGLGPVFSPGRKTLIRTTSLDRYVESFRERYS
jgi:hypothetical protein